MKLVTYLKEGQEQLAFCINDNLYDTDMADSRLPRTMMALLNDWESLSPVARSVAADIESGKNPVMSYAAFASAHCDFQ